MSIHLSMNVVVKIDAFLCVAGENVYHLALCRRNQGWILTLCLSACVSWEDKREIV